MKPKRFSSKYHREVARRIRDSQWELMQRVATLGTLWFCVWNKRQLPELADEKRCGLIDGMEYLEWMDQHPDAGHTALDEREKYDMEPVTGGLVEPGFVITPATRKSCIQMPK